MSEIMSRNGNAFDVVDADRVIENEYFDRVILDNRCMSGVTFEHCVFINCLFRYCDLSHVRFDNCTFIYCYFTSANFDTVSFSGSSIISCNFSCVVYRCDRYYYAGFTHCSISSTVFDGSDSFNSCDIQGSHFDKCSFPKDFDIRRFGEVLEEDIIGWKKCECDDHISRCIVKLLVPKGSVVFSINGKKCRTNKCKVLDIIGMGATGKIHISRANSMYHSVSRKFTYYVGDEFNIKNFDMDYAKECATGIHFFKDKLDAWKY